MRRSRGLALAALVALLTGGAAWADGEGGAPVGDPAQGRKAAGMCRTCHGLDGIARIPIAPHIGGESAGYLAAQLRAFRSGDRVHEMMSIVSASLSDRAIADLAAWYGSLAAQATPPDDHAGRDGPDECTACHGVDGLAQVGDAPNLAGETDMYIIAQLQSFRIGKRRHAVMNAVAEDLTDDDIQALADWYSAIGYAVEMPE